MAAENEKTFYEYLAEKAEDPEDDITGDFALDAEADSFFPRTARANAEGFEKVMKYLYYNRGGWNRVLDAFMETWSEYYRTVTGRCWVSSGYNNRIMVK